MTTDTTLDATDTDPDTDAVMFDTDWHDDLRYYDSPDDLTPKERGILRVAASRPTWTAADIEQYGRDNHNADIDEVEVAALVRIALPYHARIGRGDLSDRRRTVVEYAEANRDATVEEIAEGVGLDEVVVDDILSRCLPEHPAGEPMYDPEGVDDDALAEYVVDGVDPADLTDDQRRVLSVAATNTEDKPAKTYVYYALGGKAGDIPYDVVSETVDTYFAHPVFRTWEQLTEDEQALIDALIRKHGEGTATSNLDTLREMSRDDITRLRAVAENPTRHVHELKEEYGVGEHAKALREFDISKQEVRANYDDGQTVADGADVETDVGEDDTDDEEGEDDETAVAPDTPFRQDDLREKNLTVLDNEADEWDVEAQTVYYARVSYVHDDHAFVALNGFYGTSGERVSGAVFPPGLPMFYDFGDLRRGDEVAVGLWKRKEDGDLQFNVLANYSGEPARTFEQLGRVRSLPTHPDVGSSPGSATLPNTSADEDESAEDDTEAEDVEPIPAVEADTESVAAADGGEGAAATLDRVREVLRTTGIVGDEDARDAADDLMAVLDSVEGDAADKMAALRGATTMLVQSTEDGSGARRLVDAVDSTLD